MGRLVSKLLLLFAVLLMPFGMAPAAGAADHMAATSMPMQHCPEQAPTHHGKAGFVECTMACSAALPAADLSREEPRISIGEPVRSIAMKQLHGLHPETATPPPKTA